MKIAMGPLKEIQLILASNDPDDEARLRALLAGTPWAVLAATTLDDAIRALHEIALPIVLLDRDFDHRSWPETTRALLKARRRTCVIVLGDAGPPDADDVLRRGGFDALARPLEKDELFATLISAYSTARMHWLSVSRVHANPIPAPAP